MLALLSTRVSSVARVWKAIEFPLETGVPVSGDKFDDSPVMRTIDEDATPPRCDDDADTRASVAATTIRHRRGAAARLSCVWTLYVMLNKAPSFVLFYFRGAPSSTRTRIV